MGISALNQKVVIAIRRVNVASPSWHSKSMSANRPLADAGNPKRVLVTEIVTAGIFPSHLGRALPESDGASFFPERLPFVSLQY